MALPLAMFMQDVKDGSDIVSPEKFLDQPNTVTKKANEKSAGEDFIDFFSEHLQSADPPAATLSEFERRFGAPNKGVDDLGSLASCPTTTSTRIPRPRTPYYPHQAVAGSIRTWKLPSCR